MNTALHRIYQLMDQEAEVNKVCEFLRDSVAFHPDHSKELSARLRMLLNFAKQIVSGTFLSGHLFFKDSPEAFYFEEIKKLLRTQSLGDFEAPAEKLEPLRDKIKEELRKHHMPLSEAEIESLAIRELEKRVAKLEADARGHLLGMVL